MIKKRVSEFLIICIIGCIWGCKNRENDSVSETKSITLERFDQDLQKFISGNMSDTARFIKEYSDFLSIYCYEILNLIQNNPQDSLYSKTGLNKFFSNSAIKKLYKDTESEFKTTDDIESRIIGCFFPIFPPISPGLSSQSVNTRVRIESIDYYYRFYNIHLFRSLSWSIISGLPKHI